jgi:integrase
VTQDLRGTGTKAPDASARRNPFATAYRSRRRRARRGRCDRARGSRLGLENWKRSVNWKAAITKIGRNKMRVHDLRPTYASLSRRAGADLRLLQKAMGHASIAVTAHTYADLFDHELDNIAAALDSLDDLSRAT